MSVKRKWERNKGRKEEKRRDKQNLVVLKCMWQSRSKKSLLRNTSGASSAQYVPFQWALFRRMRSSGNGFKEEQQKWLKGYDIYILPWKVKNSVLFGLEKGWFYCHFQAHKGFLWKITSIGDFLGLQGMKKHNGA